MTVEPVGVVRSGGLPLTPPGTYSRQTAKYPAATSGSWLLRLWNLSSSPFSPPLMTSDVSPGRNRESRSVEAVSSSWTGNVR